MLWFLYSLLSGFFFATSDALTKKVELNDDYVIAWARIFFGLPLLLPVLFFVTPTFDTTFWITIAILIPIDTLLFIFYLKAIRISPLSLTVPFLSLTPLFLIVTSFVLLGEKPSAVGAIGIFLLALGGYSLHLHKVKKGLLEPFKAIIREKGSLLMILVAFMTSITANLVKIAIEHSNPLFMFVVHFPLLVTVLSLLFIKRILKNIHKIRQEKSLLMGAGICNSLMFIFHNLAAPLVIVPYMISIKRSSSLFAVLYGYFIFKEKNIAQRFVGAALMMAGAAIILIFQ